MDQSKKLSTRAMGAKMSEKGDDVFYGRPLLLQYVADYFPNTIASR